MTSGTEAGGSPGQGGTGRQGERGSDGSRLSPRREALVRVSAALATGAREPLRRALRAAAGRASAEEIEEVLLQSYLFLGFPAALTGLAEWRSISAPPAGRAGEARRESPDGDGGSEHLERGRELCRRIYGDSYEKLRRNVRRLHPAMDRWMVEEGYGKVLGRPGLGLAERELCVVAALAVTGYEPQLHSHLRGALNAGAPADAVEEALELGLQVRARGEHGSRSDHLRELWTRVRRSINEMR